MFTAPSWLWVSRLWEVTQGRATEWGNAKRKGTGRGRAFSLSFEFHIKTSKGSIWTRDGSKITLIQALVFAEDNLAYYTNKKRTDRLAQRILRVGTKCVARRAFAAPGTFYLPVSIKSRNRLCKAVISFTQEFI